MFEGDFCIKVFLIKKTFISKLLAMNKHNPGVSGTKQIIFLQQQMKTWISTATTLAAT